MVHRFASDSVPAFRRTAPVVARLGGLDAGATFSAHKAGGRGGVPCARWGWGVCLNPGGSLATQGRCESIGQPLRGRLVPEQGLATASPNKRLRWPFRQYSASADIRLAPRTSPPGTFNFINRGVSNVMTTTSNTQPNTDPAAPGYLPGTFPEEKRALEELDAASAALQSMQESFDKFESERKFLAGESAARDDDASNTNEKIRQLLANPQTDGHRELIELRAEMREHLVMSENYLFLANASKDNVGHAEEKLQAAADRYRTAYAQAFNLIADNMLESSMASLQRLLDAMYFKARAMDKGVANPKPEWEMLGFDSSDDAIVADVRKRIALLYKTVDSPSLDQLPPQIANRANTSAIKVKSPAMRHVEGFANGGAERGEQHAS